MIPSLATLDCILYEPQHGRPGLAPPASSPPKVNVTNSSQSDFVGKNSRRTQNGWSLAENIVKLNHTFQNHSLSYFWYPAFITKITNAFNLTKLHSELTDGEIWSCPRGKTLANPWDSFYLKVKSTRKPSHWQLGTCVPYPMEITIETKQAHLSAVTNKNSPIVYLDTNGCNGNMIPQP